MRRGDVIADRFELGDRVGSGGASVVHRAIDRVTGEVVAIKQLVRDQQARFDREARVLAQLDHPAVVRYVAHGETPGGEHWLALEWLTGELLAARLVAGPLSVRETVALGLGVADALGAAHARGIVHRDIKPENLQLVGGEAARVKLLDFGIARVGKLPRDTRAGMVLGTLGYMAPEQANGAAAIDARVDVFSLGCVLFECLTGAPVFAVDDLLAMLARMGARYAPRARARRSDVPAALDDLLARMLATEPGDRPRDGGAVAAELAAIAERVGAPSARALATRPGLTQAEQEILGAMLVDLDPAARRALRAASVFGETFWAGGVAALLGGEVSVGARLGDLVAADLVHRRRESRFAGEEEYAFRYAPVRDAAHAMLTEQDRRLGHQLAGEWLERAGETDARILAAHFEDGEDRVRAVGWYLRAAEQAFERRDLDAVLVCAERGAACGAAGEAQGALSLWCAKAHRRRGEPALAGRAASRPGGEAARCARAAMALLAPGGPLWFAAAREAILAASGDELIEAVRRVRAEPLDESVAGAQLGALSAAHGRLLAEGRPADAAAVLPAIEALRALALAGEGGATAPVSSAGPAPPRAPPR